MLGQEYVPFCNCCTFYSEGSNAITILTTNDITPHLQELV